MNEPRKMLLLNGCTNYAKQIWKSQPSPQDWKGVFVPIPMKGNAK